MEPKDEIRKRQDELRKIEKQAKSLIFKMKRLEIEWAKLRNSLSEGAKEKNPPTLGDALSRWSKLDGIKN